MSDENPFFITRGDVVWACWLSGKPAVMLGAKEAVSAAMKEFLGTPPNGGAAPAEPPRPSPPAAAPAPPQNPTVEPAEFVPSEPSRAVVKRTHDRHELTILGRVYTGKGARDVTILDLSESGCRFHDRFGTLETGTPLTIKIGPVGPVAGAVRWRRKEYVGVEFEAPLYPAVLEHIRQHFDIRST